jgi:site-specific recombinase XerD
MAKIDLAKFTSAFRADAKGGLETRLRAAQTFERLQEHAKKQSGWGVEITPATLSAKQIAHFAAVRLSKGLDPKTVNNEVSHLRRCIQGAGRDLGNVRDPVNHFSNQRLGIPKIEKKPAREPASQEKTNAAIANTRPEIAATIQLQAALGLRAQEAVMGTHYKEWAGAIKDARALGHPTACLTVDEGTKGGKTRHVNIPASRFDAVQAAVERASELRGDRPHLIEAFSKKEGRFTLAAAKESYSNATRYAGLTGHDSNHGLRRAFAVSQLGYYRGLGYDDKRASILISRDLGHGDSRGQWVIENYISSASFAK